MAAGRAPLRVNASMLRYKSLLSPRGLYPGGASPKLRDDAGAE